MSHPKQKLLSQKLLKRLIYYNSDTGEFTWLSAQGTASPGKNAGFFSKQLGYKLIKVNKHIYVGSRLAFLYMSGRWPECFIDHKDGNRANDAWKNLREANRSENAQNAKRNTRNTTGIKVVYYLSTRDRYVVYIRVNGKSKFICAAKKIEDAKKSYEDAAKKYYGEFARMA